MDHDLTPATDPGTPAAGRPESGASAPGHRFPPRPRSAREEMDAGGVCAGGDGDGSDGGGGAGTGAETAGTDGRTGPVGAGDDSADDASAGRAESHGSTRLAGGVGTVRLASPGSVVASIPLLFGFHPENSLVVLGIGGSTSGGRYIRHGVRIDLDQIRGQERTAALELAARLRDHDADIAILVAFGPRGATGAKARPDHCRKLMAAFRAQIEAAPTEERVTVVDALYTSNGRWWSYMCRNPRCCPTTGTVVPAEAPTALATALTTRGHTVYPTREALDATLAPYPPDVLARTAAAAETLDPTWYDTDPGLAEARRLMDTLLARFADPTPARSTSAARIIRRRLSSTATIPATASAAPSSEPAAAGRTTPRRRTAAASDRARLAAATAEVGSSSRSSGPDSPAGERTSPPRARAAATSPRRGLAASAALPAAHATRRVTNRVPEGGPHAGDPSAPLITDAEAAQLLIALLNWRVRDYLACAAATEESAGRLLRLCTELARRAPHPELRLAPYALAAWAAWASGRPSVAQCAVDRALAIDPEYKFASLIRAGLHHAIDGEGVRESAANTRRDLFGDVVVGSDSPDPDSAPAPVPSQRSTESVPSDTDLEVP